METVAIPIDRQERFPIFHPQMGMLHEEQNTIAAG
jgi:hypothetical protein